MKIRKAIAIAATTLIVCNTTIAEEKKATGSGPNPFSDCGIGAALFPNHPVGAVISNVIWDIGTTAVTSATASPETCSGKNVKAAAFIMESYDQLLAETAKGNGSHITSLFDILEVPEANREGAFLSIRSQVAQELANNEYLTQEKQIKASNYYDIVLSSL